MVGVEVCACTQVERELSVLLRPYLLQLTFGLPFGNTYRTQPNSIMFTVFKCSDCANISQPTFTLSLCIGFFCPLALHLEFAIPLSRSGRQT